MTTRRIDEDREKAIANALAENRQEFLSFLERRVESRALAEDIMQEAFARGLDRLDGLRETESAVAWFYRVLRNAVIDHHRRRGAELRAFDGFARELESRDEPGPELASAVCQCVTRVASTLKTEYRTALERIDVEGLPVKAFAEEQGISRSNAGVRVFRAREALRKQLSISCGACAEHGCLDCSCSA